ncbi:MAG: hypothetical protein ACREB8_14460 [Pseudolabrys sp.]
MITRAFLVAGGLLAVSLTPALAENLSATVTAWEPVTRTITLDDLSQFADIPKTVAIPASLKAGDAVTVDYEAGENGYEAINSVTILDQEVAKRLLKSLDKRG